MIARIVIATACATACGAIAAEAQSYPMRPIRIIAPLGAGGSGDVLARLIAEPMTQRLGQQVVVDNRPGANGIIGMELVAKANPDGYTLVVVSTGNIAINPSVVKASGARPEQ